MKVAFVSPWRHEEGISIYAHALAERLKQEVQLEVYPLDKVELTRVPLAKINENDLAHLQHELSFWGSFTRPSKPLFFQFAEKIRRPLVVTFHTVDYEGHDWKRWPIWGKYRFRAMHKLPDHSIVHTHFCQKKLVELGVAEDKISVVPHGIFAPEQPTPDLQQEVLKRYKLEQKRIMLMHGFINPDKNYELVLESLPLLEDEVVLIIAGGVQNEANQAYYHNLLKKVTNLGLEKRVIVTGFLPRSEVSTLIFLAEVVLSPRKHVNASGSLAWAIGFHKPILCSNQPFFEEINEQVPCLEIFEIDQPYEFREKMRRLLHDQGLRQKLIENTQEYAKRFGWPKIAQQTLQLYEKVLRRS